MSENGQDFYEVLGLTAEEKKLQGDAFKDVLTKKYRQLAMKWHPDRHVGETEEQKKEAEEKFKEISEAYSTLSDPQKRQEYDMGGQDPFAGFNPFRGHGFNPFSGGFGFDFGNRRQQPVGEDILVDVSVSLKEAFNGAEKTISFSRNVKCHHCNGTGFEDGKPHECPTCHGTGAVEKQSRKGNMFFSQTTVCPTCHGTGLGGSFPKCKECGGSGLKASTETMRIRILPGTFDGMAVGIREAGHDAVGEGIRGDLNIRFHITDYCGYEVIPEEMKVIKRLEISLTESLLGFKRTIEGLDGKTMTVSSNKPIGDGYSITYSGKGMPHPQNNAIRGDMEVIIKVKLPNKLTDEQKEIIKKLNF